MGTLCQTRAIGGAIDGEIAEHVAWYGGVNEKMERLEPQLKSFLVRKSGRPAFAPLCLEFLGVLRLDAVVRLHPDVEQARRDAGGEPGRVVVHVGGMHRLFGGGEERRVLREAGVLLGLLDSRSDVGAVSGLVERCVRERHDKSREKLVW